MQNGYAIQNAIVKNECSQREKKKLNVKNKLSMEKNIKIYQIIEKMSYF